MNREYIPPSILATICVVIASIFVNISSDRPLTNLEDTLFQVFILLAGLISSFLFGRIAAKKAAFDLVKPHARSAFRRLLSLYYSLSRLASTIQLSRESNNNHDIETQAILDKLEAIVIEQISTADDALEDWRDIIPDDVDEIINRQKKPKAGDRNDISNTW